MTAMALDPWSSKEIKYERVFKEFGLSKLKPKWSKQFNHFFFERGITVAHRDFSKIAGCIEEKKPFINMTGLASSGQVHFGHKAIIDAFLLFKSFGAKNYFCIADIEGYSSKKNIISIEQAKETAVHNLKHVLAFGLSKKDVYVQSNYLPRYYSFVFELSKKITRNMFEATYGHVDLGKISAALLQYADILHPQLPEFEGSMPSITVIGLDQDPHARLARDIARRLSFVCEPSFLHLKHQSGLLEGIKMSSSEPQSAIFLDDSPEQAKKKISNAFTGGRETAALQRKLGGKPEICKICELLSFNFPDTAELNQITEECRSGKRLCGETKAVAIDFVGSFLKKHQKKAEKKEGIARKLVFG